MAGSDPSVHEIEAMLESVFFGCVCAVIGGIVLAYVLRRCFLRWTWALFGPFLAVFAVQFSLFLGFALGGGGLLGAALGWRWHRDDLRIGVDFAQAARERVGIRHVIRRQLHRARIRSQGWIVGGSLIVGEDARGLPVTIPAARESGTHTLVVGATGSGKTVSETWIACRLIEHGHAAVVVDPKGDKALRGALSAAAEHAGAPFLAWSPEGPSVYNPYAHGTDGELADKALAGETFTEPHYLRQAQRYLGHAVRAMRAAELPVDPVSLVRQLDPGELEVTARGLPEGDGEVLQSYLDGLSERQRRDLTGVRDRLSILAESELARWLTPNEHAPTIDLLDAIRERAVVYFRLDADRRPLLSEMLAAAVVSDLVTVTAELHRDPIPTVVVLDEFAAIAAGQVNRLFGRARSAGISLVLGTQELADLRTTDKALLDQVLGNLSAVVAHRQNVPESAELLAAMGGSTPAWVQTEQTGTGFLGGYTTGRGSQRRGYEFLLHPARLKTLGVGEAAVICPGSGWGPVVARMLVE
jgi:conjugal transfer pilus assembly protein TraD